jgi:hypothetical protein
MKLMGDLIVVIRTKKIILLLLRIEDLALQLIQGAKKISFKAQEKSG